MSADISAAAEARGVSLRVVLHVKPDKCPSDKVRVFHHLGHSINGRCVGHSALGTVQQSLTQRCTMHQLTWAVELNDAPASFHACVVSDGRAHERGLRCATASTMTPTGGSSSGSPALIGHYASRTWPAVSRQHRSSFCDTMSTTLPRRRGSGRSRGKARRAFHIFLITKWPLLQHAQSRTWEPRRQLAAMGHEVGFALRR